MKLPVASGTCSSSHYHITTFTLTTILDGSVIFSCGRFISREKHGYQVARWVWTRYTSSIFKIPNVPLRPMFMSLQFVVIGIRDVVFEHKICLVLYVVVNFAAQLSQWNWEWWSNDEIDIEGLCSCLFLVSVFIKRYQLSEIVPRRLSKFIACFFVWILTFQLFSELLR